ncbi:MAG: OmpA family protein [Gammaproteobacteria bacterium]|nr:OmpA family protein [Gammaproteobacteria bacterium]
MRITTRLALTSLIISTLVLAGCATDEYGRSRPLTETEKGALIGSISGALIGAVASKKDKRTKGVLIGAIGGGLAGAAVGNYMDSQKKDFEKVLAPERESGAILVEKLPKDVLRVTMTAQTAFDVNSAQIKPNFNSTMDKIGKIVNKYGKTTLDIVGHTDNTGSHKYNQELSERRAQAVAQYFVGQNVHPERLRVEGAGETQPRADNATAEGRAQNRRVEIIIEPVVADS